MSPAPAGAALGVNSRPAKPGAVFIAYGIGLGDVTPSILPGVIVWQSNTLTNAVKFSFRINNRECLVRWSGRQLGGVIRILYHRPGGSAKWRLPNQRDTEWRPASLRPIPNRTDPLSPDS